MKKVSAVILNWNGLKLMKEFLPSVREFTDLSIADVVIAVNGSEVDSLDYVKSNFPEFKVFAMKENHGFAEGYNIAIENIDTEYSVRLNSDVRVTKNWL